MLLPGESLHTRVLDNLTTAVLLLDQDLHIRYINPAAEVLLDVSGLRVKGEPLASVFRGIDALVKELGKAVVTSQAYTKRQTQLQPAQGHEITVDYAVTPVNDRSGVSLIMEILPLDRLLRISREDAIITSQQRTRTLVRGLAHEIKNPLGGLRGAAQLLARELPSDHLRDYTNIIIEEADRLRDLVDRMLGPHKLPDFKPLNIHEVLEHVRNLIEAETDGAICFNRDYDPSIPELIGDRQQLIQAVLNIVRNAMQALTSNGLRHAEIILRTRALRKFTIGSNHHRLVCKIDVIDNGPGIPTDLQESIFYPMVSGRPDGTGLGLSISQSIINQHQGLIECESEPGNTKFSLYIPLEPMHESHE